MMNDKKPPSSPIKDRHCYRVSRLVSLSQDQSLSFGQMVYMQSHLMMCRNCRDFSKNIDKLGQMMKAYKNRKR